MTDWQRIREQVDACRPDSQDLNDPELRDAADAIECDERARRLFESSQRLDSKVRRAMRDVEVPNGLEQRLLAQFTPVATTQVRSSRRRFWTIGIFTTATCLLIAVGIVLTRPGPLSLQQLSALAT